MVISWPDTSIFDISCSKRIIFDPPFAHYVLLASGIYSLFNWSSFFYAEDHLQILVFQQSSKSKSFATRNFFILQTMISYGYHEDEIFQMYNFWATFQVEYLLGLLFHVTPFFSNYTKWSKPHSSRDQNTNNLWKGSYSFFISCTFFVPPFEWNICLVYSFTWHFFFSNASPRFCFESEHFSVSLELSFMNELSKSNSRVHSILNAYVTCSWYQESIHCFTIFIFLCILGIKKWVNIIISVM